MNKLTLSEYFKALRVKVALKVVLAGIICIVINNLFHLNLDYFSLLFVLLILVLFHGDVLKAGAITIIGCIVSGVVSLVITYLFFDSKVIYILLLSVWIFFVVAILVKHFLAMLISGVAATMVMYNTIYNSVSYSTSLFEYYVVQLILAVVVCYIIDELVWPNHSRGKFQITLSTVYQELSGLFDGYRAEKIIDRKNHKSISTSLPTFNNLVSYVNRMRSEEKDKDFPFEAYMKIITFSRGIYIKTEVLEEFVLKEHSFIKEDRVASNLDRVLEIVSQSFSELAQSIGTKDVVNIEGKDLDEAMSSLHEIYREMHEVEGKEDEYYDDLHAYGAMLPVLDDITGKLKKIVESINIFHTNSYREMMSARLPHTQQVEEIREKSFFNIDKQSAIVGIKTVVIFLILMFGEVIFGLPGGGQVVFFAILFGVVPNLGQAYMKSRYGIIGVCAGIVFSYISLLIVSISPHFLIVVSLYALGTFAATYVASSSKDISVAGLQAGLLFPFGILLTTGPNLDISSALTRFLALFSAVLIGLIVQHTLWPTSPLKILKEKISKSINFSGEIMYKLVTLDIKDQERIDDIVLPLAASLPTSTSLLHDAEYIIREDELHAEQFIKIIESIELLYAELETLKRTITERTDNELINSFLTGMEDDYTKSYRLFEQVSHQFAATEGYADEITTLREEIEKHVTQVRESGEWRSYTPEEVEKLILVVTSMDSMLESLGVISTAIYEIDQKDVPESNVLVAKQA